MAARVNEAAAEKPGRFDAMVSAADAAAAAEDPMFADAKAMADSAKAAAKAHGSDARLEAARAILPGAKHPVPTSAEDTWSKFYLFPKLQDLLGPAGQLHLTFDQATLWVRPNGRGMLRCAVPSSWRFCGVLLGSERGGRWG